MMEAAVSMAGAGNCEASVKVGQEATDEALVEAFQRGDETAFDGLFLKHQDYVFSLARNLVARRRI